VSSSAEAVLRLGIDPRELRLDRMFTQPFRDDPGERRSSERRANSSTNAS
jgi:hypothetical protein